MGAGLMLFYDIIRGIRRAGALKSYAAVFVTDVLFWVISAFIVYIFLLGYESGAVRLYVLLGALIGALIFSKVCSSFVVKAVSLAFRPLIKFLGFIGDKCKNWLRFLINGVKNVEKTIKRRIKSKKTLETADNGSV